jgi:hypothetical protein
MSSDTVLGLDAKLYRNASVYASPDWNEVIDVSDVTLPLTKGEANVGRRGAGGWDAVVGALKSGGVNFTLILRKDATSQADFEAFRDSFLNNESVDMAIMDGDITTTGSEGLRARMEVFDLTRGEPLAGALTYNVGMKITDDDNPPEWLEIA